MKIKNNLVYYNTDDLILACHNLNQIHTYLSNQMKKVHDDDKAFLFSLFDDTFAGEVIKVMNQKKSRKKVQKVDSVNPTT